MHLTYTPHQLQLRTLVRDFALAEIAPTVRDRDVEERFERRIFDRLAELGLTGLPWPAAFGGSGEPFLHYAMVIEELSQVCASTGVMLSVHTSLTSWAIHTFGTAAQQEAFLLPLAEGKVLGAYCLTESESGSDAGAMRTTARRDGDSYVLNGSKLFITSGGEAEVYIVFALTEPALKQKGISAFVVEKGTAGLTFGKKEKKLGIRASSTLEMLFDDCRIPAHNLLGQEGNGFHIALRCLDGGRIGIAAQALGIAQAALDAGRDMGVNLSALRELATEVQAARLLMYHAAWRKDRGLPYGKQAAMAKLWASDTAVKVTNDVVRLAGKDGIVPGSTLERCWRDAKVTQIYEGTNEIQRIVISRWLLSEGV
ncbi:acyl-CoA dehydrogenase family protein [Paenibacillus whitsoniae]|uniref:Acyl-CoA dehydrogenase n=1 Tax=Paenibacillus whitsoniae TaxID=2496558 RepID=A0A430J9L1_9BACL|nr:acyl-CoA dehydrogenase family protein [Paenibacillus whitsoniae]RTE07131.1 acyl-CoA dehydrogenase [Paenibacillus whitsoniae]